MKERHFRQLVTEWERRIRRKEIERKRDRENERERERKWDKENERERERVRKRIKGREFVRTFDFILKRTTSFLHKLSVSEAVFQHF